MTVTSPWSRALDALRRHAAHGDPTPQMAALGLLAGLLTAGVMLLFRAAIELPLRWVMAGGDEAFATLAPVVRVGLVLSGAVVLAAYFHRLPPRRRSVGVVHVMEQLHADRVPLPIGNAVAQFIGGALALLTGQSGGREGPAVHLGATTASSLGGALGLPANGTRLLASCGVAAAIAASFNTPLAGVVFAMEVVMFEYTMAGFIPVLLAAVAATLVNRAVLGDHTAFVVPQDMRMHSLREYVVFAVEAPLFGCVAGVFMWVTQRCTRLPIESTWLRLVAAGGVTAALSLAVPQVMGIGYGYVGLALAGTLPLATLALIGAAKLVASAFTYAMRVPVGIIGPTFVIGACAGGVGGAVAHWLAPSMTGNPDLHVMLGMGAMMGAVLQAPLAALVAVIELTGKIDITLPSMLVIVVATIVARSVFGRRSLFIETLEARGLHYSVDPIAQHLRRVGVVSVMDRRVQTLRERASFADANAALAADPRWIVVERGRRPLHLIDPAVLQRLIEQTERSSHELDLGGVAREGQRVATISARASLYEARVLLERPDVDALCVREVTGGATAPTIGVLLRADVIG